ncbi:MAG: serine hydrolase domain-containing protein [Pseudomonadota bacterium]
MQALDRVLESAIEDGHAPGLVVSVADRNGVIYENAMGARAVGGETAMTTDTVFRAFSMTKAVGAAAAAKCIEDGLLTLETPVEDVLPEWKDVKRLDGFDADGKPILVAPSTKATLRHLATHTSGLVYEFWNEGQGAYMAATAAPTILSGAMAALHSYPLAFEPGTKWDYGTGIDWLGRMVEEVSGRRIDAYVTEKILTPTAMKDTGFELRPDMAARLTDAHAATEDGFVPYDIAPPPSPELYGMGHALYSTGPDYLRFIRMLMNGGEIDGTRVLKPETVEMFCANQIGDLSVGKMTSYAPPLTADVDFFPEQENKFSLGCLMNTADIEGKRRAGSQSWAGVLNTHYWFDPTSGVAAVIMLQHLPFVDPHCMAIYDAVERTVYAELA